MEYVSHSSEETKAFGRKLAEAAKKGEVYALIGNLGAGKTVLAKGFAEGIGITEAVSSPTFTILQEYDEGRLPFYHFDVYRIDDPVEMDEIGFEDYLDGDGVCLVEWADEVRELMPADTIRIEIERAPELGDDIRIITVTGKQVEG
ncbi:MAG: tRNA (adenosine(37)-N6)-threonylcarbamoyltransferase complex ATPase subunit type 1 TsaE [Lachnospiraceae bacterium]|nr:tRNA (adenosine(37)-N6)-threonylcarbamoyltransferase complex ATPase subunit type 1 TsaE [Lachnospiraceae bacterium]